MQLAHLSHRDDSEEECSLKRQLLKPSKFVALKEDPVQGW